MSRRITQGPSLPAPPWQWGAFAHLTAPGGFVDTVRRDLLLGAFRAADGVQASGDVPHNLEVASKKLGCSKRTLVRARVWLRDHAPELFAQLAPREMDGARVVAARWGKKSDS